MLEPSFDSLLQRVGNKYTLVVAAAKRARQLNEGSRPRVSWEEVHKPVLLALQEIADGHLECSEPEEEREA